MAEVMLFAVMICAYKGKMRTFRYGVVPFVAVVAVIVGLLYLEPHLSASVIVVLIAAIMMFAGGTKIQWFILAAGVIAVAAYFTVTKMDYAGDRISAWLHPEGDPGNTSYQIIQSLYAIGSGGLLGLGLGQGRQKYLYLPEEHNDYIFAVVCEELGFIGALLILLLFALLIVRGFWLALHARDRFGSLVVTGLTSLLAIQVFLNVAVVTNLVPSTGISLPFFSYGGTALLIQLIEMGIILSISRDIPIVKAG
jgi:cell division protein FtsW